MVIMNLSIRKISNYVVVLVIIAHFIGSHAYFSLIPAIRSTHAAFSKVPINQLISHNVIGYIRYKNILISPQATTDGKSYVEEGLNAFQLDTVTNDLNTSNRYEEGPKNRFWTRNMQLQSTDVLSMDSLPSVLRSLLELHGIDIAKLDLGLILIERMGLAVPIHDGKLQTQHITPYTTPKPEDNAVQLFGFSPRARHVTVAPSEEERPTDPERLEALLVALKQYKESDITIEELMSEQLAGTPPARCS